MTKLRAQEGVPYREACTIEIPGVTNETEGYTATMRIARRGTSILELAEGDGLTTTAATDEVTIAIDISAARTNDLEYRQYEYELDLLLDDVVELRVLRGVLHVEQSVVAG
jgi:hypothetical protein